jgi:hypothetical protein
MRATTGLLAVLLVFAVAAPEVALGQSAGDEQYVDPFQQAPAAPEGEQGGGSPGGSPEGSTGGDGSAGGGADTSPPAPTVEETAPPVTETAPGTTATPAGGSAPVLPRTGLPLAPVAAIGLLLLIGGAALRRRT